METQVWTLNWNDDMRVGFPEIDHEHRQFVTLVNDLNRAIVDRMDLVDIRKRLQALLDNARTDVAIENEVLRRHDCPDASEHIQAHQVIDRHLQEIEGGLNEGSTLYEWIEASLEIKQILIGHFLSDDPKLRHCSPS